MQAVICNMSTFSYKTKVFLTNQVVLTTISMNTSYFINRWTKDWKRWNGVICLDAMLHSLSWLHAVDGSLNEANDSNYTIILVRGQRTSRYNQNSQFETKHYIIHSKTDQYMDK